MDYRIVSIGTLSRHELWGERTPVRTAHATTTLVRSGEMVLVVDPGLPPEVVAARLRERAGVDPGNVTHVFLTNFRPAHRWGLAAFPNAQWLIAEAEREWVGRALVEQFQRQDDAEQKQLLQEEIAVLKRCQPAPDRLAKQVDLFPLPGFSPGTCGLLLSHAHSTVLLAGDAVATAEHLHQGRVLAGAGETDTARESFMEAIEIADVLVPGHDNVQLNPGRRPL